MKSTSRRNKKELLTEDQMIQLETRRIIQEQIMILEENMRICDIVIREERRMISEGYTREMINEGILDWLKQAGFDWLSYVKQYFIGKLMRKLGFDDNSIFGCAVKNVVEEAEFTEIGKYFGTGSCEPAAELIIRGMGECIQEKFLNKIANMFFGADMEGAISGTAREALTRIVNEMTETFRQPIVDFICKEASFEQLSQGLKNAMGEFSDNIGPGAAAAGAAVADAGSVLAPDSLDMSEDE